MMRTGLKIIVLASFTFLTTISSLALGAGEFWLADSSRLLRRANMEVVVDAIAYLRNPLGGYGTGVFVSPYHVLTANHILQRVGCDRSVTVQTEMQGGETPRPRGRNVRCSEIIFEDEALDVALLATDRAVRDYLPVRSDNDLTVVATEVFLSAYATQGLLGYGHGCSITMRAGPNQEHYTPAGALVNLSNYFMTDCLHAPDMGGGIVIGMDSLSERPTIIGLTSMLVTDRSDSMSVSSAHVRLWDVIRSYPDEFEEVYSLAGDRWP